MLVINFEPMSCNTSVSSAEFGKELVQVQAGFVMIFSLLAKKRWTGYHWLLEMTLMMVRKKYVSRVKDAILFLTKKERECFDKK